LTVPSLNCCTGLTVSGCFGERARVDTLSTCGWLDGRSDELIHGVRKNPKKKS
jgi:hypothetical protein